MAFHVDYWDQLGWPDRFAAEAYSNRQRALAREGLISQVYTPGIVVNSQEWRGWFNGRRDLPENNTQPGVLHVSLDGNTLNVNFAQDRRLILNFALLGMGLETQVKAGENHGKKLKHDFVVLSHWQQQGTKQWQIKMPEQEDHGQQRTVLAVWLNSPDSLKIIQAAASYID
jgi:hypothetical protein